MAFGGTRKVTRFRKNVRVNMYIVAERKIKTLPLFAYNSKKEIADLVYANLRFLKSNEKSLFYFLFFDNYLLTPYGYPHIIVHELVAQFQSVIIRPAPFSNIVAEFEQVR